MGTSNGTPTGLPPAQAAPAPGSTDQRLLMWLGRCGYALGPASVVNYLGELLLPRSAANKYLILIDIGTFLGTFVVLLRIPWRAVVRFLPQMLSLILTLVLLLPIMRNINWWKISPSVKWSRELVSSIDNECPVSPVADPDPCLVKRLGTFDRRTQSTLNDDLRIGETLLWQPRIRDVLDRCYGIKPDFLGTGLSLPDWAEGRYWVARLPEYWIQNRPDTDPTVWTWILQPNSKTLNTQLLAFLETTPPETPTGQIFSTQLHENTSHLAPNDNTPVLVRFAQFPLAEYRHKIGADNTHLVFASHLGEAVNLGLSVTDAAAYSGRSIRSTADGSAIFIWVIFTTNSRELIPATWHGLLAHIAEDSDSVNVKFPCRH